MGPLVRLSLCLTAMAVVVLPILGSPATRLLKHKQATAAKEYFVDGERYESFLHVKEYSQTFDCKAIIICKPM